MVGVIGESLSQPPPGSCRSGSVEQRPHLSLVSRQQPRRSVSFERRLAQVYCSRLGTADDDHQSRIPFLAVFPGSGTTGALDGSVHAPRNHLATARRSRFAARVTVTSFWKTPHPLRHIRANRGSAVNLAMVNPETKEPQVTCRRLLLLRGLADNS